MTKTFKQIAEVAIARYERLIAQAEAKGVSVWELKTELKKLKADFGIRMTEVEEEKTKRKEKVKVEDPVIFRIANPEIEPTWIGSEVKPNEP